MPLSVRVPACVGVRDAPSSTPRSALSSATAQEMVLFAAFAGDTVALDKSIAASLTPPEGTPVISVTGTKSEESLFAGLGQPAVSASRTPSKQETITFLIFFMCFIIRLFS